MKRCVGFKMVCVGFARVFGYQHVGILNEILLSSDLNQCEAPTQMGSCSGGI